MKHGPFRLPTPSGAASALRIYSRGAVKVGGRPWPYLNGRSFLAAFERLPVIPGKGGPPFDAPETRAQAESYLCPPVDRVALELTGKDLRELDAAFMAAAGDADEFLVGIGGRAFNWVAVGLVLPFVAVAERATLGLRGDDVLRLDAPRVRLALQAFGPDARPACELLNAEQLDAIESGRGEA